MVRPSKRLLILLLLAAGACAQDTPELDSADASFGIGKADEASHGFSACELREVLALVNESGATAEALKGVVKIDVRAATAIVAHRHGADGVAGTGDDDLFDDLAELDAIAFVGPVALEALVGHVRARCAIDLATRPYIDSTTFGGTTGGGWTRNEVEIEATYAVGGVTGRKLRELVTAKDSRGRTIYSRLRKNEVMQAFTIDYPIDEIPWNGDSHAAREAMPLMAWSVEGGRFEQPEEGGRRELSLGTDPNDDTYYDTKNHDLIASGITLRGRIRFDDAETIRRILIGAKLDSAVDPATGLKKAAKVDVRDDSARHVGTLDADVKRGKVAWSGSDVPVEPVRVVWQSLKDSGKLLAIGDKSDVLVLDPKARLRSVRSRFHLNFAKPEAMSRVYDNALAQARWVIERARVRIAAGALSGAELAAVEGFIARAEGMLDHSAVLEHARGALSAVDQSLSDILYPEAFLRTRPDSFATLEKRRIIAEAVDELMHGLADELDEVDRMITGSRSGADAKDWVEPFILWMQADDKALQRKTTARPFFELWSLVGDKAAAIADFNGFGQAQAAAGNGDFEGFEPIDEARFDALGAWLADEAIDDVERMIEAGGTMARGLYFEAARQYYVPSSWRSYGNFIIDTFDWTDMVSEAEWQTIPEEKRKPGLDLPAEKVFHTTLVNEVQLELTEVSEYVKRIEALTAQAKDKPDDAEIARNLAGARWVFDELQRSTQVLAEIKGEAILDRLEDEGGPRGMTWGPAAHAKGNTALLILTDKL